MFIKTSFRYNAIACDRVTQRFRIACSINPRVQTAYLPFFHSCGLYTSSSPDINHAKIAGPKFMRPTSIRPRLIRQTLSGRKTTPQKTSPQKISPQKASPQKASPRKASPRKASLRKTSPQETLLPEITQVPSEVGKKERLYLDNDGMEGLDMPQDELPYKRPIVRWNGPGSPINLQWTDTREINMSVHVTVRVRHSSYSSMIIGTTST